MAAVPKSYIPPHRKRLANELLDQESDAIDRKLTDIIFPEIDLYGCTLACDGKVCVDKDHRMNVICVCPSGAVFVSAVATSGEINNAEFVAKLLMDQIDRVQEKIKGSIVQVVLDTPSVNKAASSIVEAKMPSVICSPCMAHVLNLALQDFCS